MSQSILSAITAAGQLFAGYSIVTLGPVQLTGSALPPSIPIGGTQALTTHKLLGGQRIIDKMGQDDAVIDWKAILDTQDAIVIARTLDKLRRSGAVILLAWGGFSYQVIVSKFSCETRFVPPMNYSIELTVLADNTAVTGITATSMALQVVGDLTSGNPVAALSAVSAGIVGTSVSSAATAAGAANATVLGSSAYVAAVGAVNTAAGAINSAVMGANALLKPLGTSIQAISAAAPAAVDTFGLSSNFATAVQAAGDLANLTQAQGYVQRAQQNLLNASG